MNKKVKVYIGWFLRGMGMGAADVVPGVSGGTIAFITGIYEKLINSIKSINIKALQKLFSEGFASFWSYINGYFLLILFAGIATSVISLAKIIEKLLINQPILVWSFFFGLVVASAIFIAKKIDNRQYYFGYCRNRNSIFYYHCYTSGNNGCILVCVFIRSIGYMCHDFTWYFRQFYPAFAG